MLGIDRAVAGAGSAQLRRDELIIFALYAADIYAVAIIAVALQRTAGLRQQSSLP